MSFEAINNIQNVIARMNQIQTRMDNVGVKEPASFEAAYQKAIQGSLGPTSLMRAPGLPPSLSMFSYPGMGEATWVANLARENPTQTITYKDFKMQAQTAERFTKLEELLAARFPGRNVLITSTTEGQHTDPNHPAGKAIDFVVDGLTREESREVETLCLQAGLKPYNEYINSSTYKTGDHMHVDIIEA